MPFRWRLNDLMYWKRTHHNLRVTAQENCICLWRFPKKPVKRCHRNLYERIFNVTRVNLSKHRYIIVFTSALLSRTRGPKLVTSSSAGNAGSWKHFVSIALVTLLYLYLWHILKVVYLITPNSIKYYVQRESYSLVNLICKLLIRT